MQSPIKYETMEATLMQCFFVSYKIKDIDVLGGYNPITVITEDEPTHLPIGRLYNLAVISPVVKS